MDPERSDRDDDLRNKLRSWTERNSSHPATDQEKLEHEAVSLAQRLGQEGFMAYAIPRLYGGIRETVQAQDLCLIREELAYSAALADVMFGVQALAAQPMIIAGTEDQKKKHLPPLARGEAIGAFALTESEAGSDASAISLRAKKVSSGYSLTGNKRFISNAGIAHTYIVFATTMPEAKAKGISAFIVPANAPGFTVTERTRLLSPHPIGVLGFNDCFIAQDGLLGIEGGGLKIALQALDILRCTVAASAVGFARRALAEAITYSRRRHQFGRAIGEFQSIQFKIAEMAADLEASRLLVYEAAAAHDQRQPKFEMKSSIAKLFATEAAQRIVDQALQIHGGNGVVAGHIMERLYRDVRALRIYEGTSEIQKLLIARELLK